jgi:hypothetical protein
MERLYVRSTLNVLRRLTTGSGTWTAGQYLEAWVGSIDPASHLRAAAEICDNALNSALVAEKAPDLEEEGRIAVITTCKSLATAFGPTGLNVAIVNYVNNPRASTETLAAFASSLEQVPSIELSDVNDLQNEVAKLCDQVKQSNIDAMIKQVIVSHLQLIVGLLGNVDLFGIDASIATFKAMILKAETAALNKTENRPFLSNISSKLWNIWKRLGELRDGLTAGRDLVEIGQDIVQQISTTAGS